MTQPTTPAKACEACREPIAPSDAFGTMHRACIDRLLAPQRRRSQSGASMIEYAMLLAFVAVIAIIGVRAVGPATANLFDVDRLDLGPVATEVLGTTVERDTTIGTGVTVERPPAACLVAAGRGGTRPICPR